MAQKRLTNIFRWLLCSNILHAVLQTYHSNPRKLEAESKYIRIPGIHPLSWKNQGGSGWISLSCTSLLTLLSACFLKIPSSSLLSADYWLSTFFKVRAIISDRTSSHDLFIHSPIILVSTFIFVVAMLCHCCIRRRHPLNHLAQTILKLAC